MAEQDPTEPDGRKMTRIRRGRSERLTEGATLERDLREPEPQHRGLLLYAMQDPKHRKYRPVGASMNRDHASVRNWAETWAWQERIERDGAETAQARACQLYRELYYPSWGIREVACVERWMSVPFLSTSPPPRDLSVPGRGHGDKLGDLRHTVDRQDAERTDRGPTTPAAAAIGSRNFMERGSSVIEALVASLARRLRDDPQSVRVQPGHLAALLKEWREIREYLDGIAAPPGSVAGAVEPSIRVQIASRTGTSVLAAMREDAEEALAVLRGMEAAERVAAELDAAQAARTGPHIVDAG